MISNLGNKIKALRLKNNMSQNDLCGECLNRVILSKIENNKMLPSIPQLIYISEKLGKSVNYLLTDSDVYDFVDNNINKELNDFEKLYIKECFYDIVKSFEFNSCVYNDNLDFRKFYYVGMSYFNLGIYHEALKYLKKYLNLYSKKEQIIQENQIQYVLDCLNTLFKIMLRNKNYNKGKSYLLIAKKYLYLYGASNTLTSFIIHSNLAFIYLHINEFSSIIGLLEPFLSTHQNLQYVKIMPDIYISLNIAYYNIGDYEKSIMYIKKAIYMLLCQENYEEAAKCNINYINALRYTKRYNEALEIIKKCKEDYLNFEIIYNRFFIQEMIIYFNLGDYSNMQKVAEKVNLKVLPKISKCNYYYLLGINDVIKHNYKSAHAYLLKCEKVFLNESYTYDLKILFEALYLITEDVEYKHKAENCVNITSRKNIFIDTDFKLLEF